MKKITLPPALQYPAYRNYWLGMFCAVSGYQVLTFGQFWLMHELTGSPLYLGYVGIAQALPAISLNLVGGVVADKLDKKRLVFLTMASLAVLVLLLGFLTLFKVVKVWHIMLIAVLSGAINAFNQPARMSLYPTLVPRKALTSAVALHSSVWQATRIVSPAISGNLITFFGTAAAFFFSAAGMVAFATVVYCLQVPKIENIRGAKPWKDLMEGLTFVKQNSIFSFLMGMAFFISFFGMTYVSQMPVFAVDILKIGAKGQGMLLSLIGVGSLMTAFGMGYFKLSNHKGPVIIGAATLSGLSVAGFAVTSRYIGSYPLACFFMLITGVFTYMAMISIMVSLQMMVPDHMRGRVMGFYGITYSITPLGGMYAGVMAGFIGTPMAVALGGIFVSLFALGPAFINREVRMLGMMRQRIESY